jgi:uncharacterized membrane protein
MNTWLAIEAAGMIIGGTLALLCGIWYIIISVKENAEKYRKDK